MFFKQSRFILADLGNAVHLAPGSSITGIAGTRAFSSPEMLAGLEYTHKTDIFSWGASLHKMLTKTLPYNYSALDLTHFERTEEFVQLSINVSIKHLRGCKSTNMLIYKALETTNRVSDVWNTLDELILIIKILTEVINFVCLFFLLF
jgi:serine/threonine protein kinase